MQRVLVFQQTQLVPEVLDQKISKMIRYIFQIRPISNELVILRGLRKFHG